MPAASRTVLYIAFCFLSNALDANRSKTIMAASLLRTVLFFAVFARICTGEKPVECCASSREELIDLGKPGDACNTGWSESCFVKFNFCRSCPKGTCNWISAAGRNYCLCAMTFLQDSWDGMNEACSNSVGKKWPDSVGMNDSRTDSCVDFKEQSECDCDMCSSPSPPLSNEEKAAVKANKGTIIGASVGGAMGIIAATVAAVIGAKYARTKAAQKGNAQTPDPTATTP